MDDHQNARLTVHSREQMCRAVLEEELAAAKWIDRYRELGAAGVNDRSSRPRRLRKPTSDELVVL